MKIYGINIPPALRGEWNDTALISVSHAVSVGKAGGLVVIDGNKHKMELIEPQKGATK